MTDLSPNTQPVAVYGAGSWGTALALQLSRQEIPIHLWTNEAEHAARMQQDGNNELFLSGLKFPNTIKPTANIQTGLNDNPRYILIAVPSIGFSATLKLLAEHINPEIGIVWATKGLDPEGKELFKIARELLGEKRPLAVLSGPSFALEVARGLPTAVVIASTNKTFGQQLSADFNSKTFRTYPSSDLIGVGIGGVVKNVLAIATGISDGMQLGANARCALITRGLSEMTRLGLTLGAQAETFTGLACLGDLVLTATDDQSRNRRLGLAIGQGKTPSLAEKEIGQIVEGKDNARQLTNLAKEHKVEMPITAAVWEILQGKITPKTALAQLLARKPVEAK